MSDQELRDKLAGEGVISEMTGELVPRWHRADFKAGWDAARANDKEQDQLREQLQWSLRNEQQYKDELKASLERENQLRAENKYLRTMALNPLSVNDMDETIRLKAQCEKLAEALKACEDVAYSYDMKPEGFSVVFCTAKQALAEYRKANKC